MTELKEAIEKLLEEIKVVPATDDAEGVTCCKMRVSDYVKIDQALAKLKEQPPASDFIKECRELRKSRGATHEQWEYAEKMMEACEIIARQASQLKAKDELLFAYESVRAPKQPPAGEFTIEARELNDSENVPKWAVRKRLGEACDRLDRSEASRKEIHKTLEPVLDWYGGGTEGNRSDIEIITDVVSDLQKDRAEVLTLKASRKELLAACVEALRIADSWTHDQLDGTSFLKEALKELEPIKAVVEKHKEGD